MHNRPCLATVTVSVLAGMLVGSAVGTPAAQAQGEGDQPPRVQLVGIAADPEHGIVYRAWSDGRVEYNPWLREAPRWENVPTR